MKTVSQITVHVINRKMIDEVRIERYCIYDTKETRRVIYLGF